MDTNLNSNDLKPLNNAPFRLSDIYLFSLQLEVRSIRLYTNLSETMQEPALQGVFYLLSKEEVKHRDFFQEKIKNLEFPGKKEIKTETLRELVLLMRQKLFDPAVLGDKLEKVDGFDSAMDFAMGMERDQILYYQEIRNHVENIRNSIDELVLEEKNHYLKLQQLKERNL